MQDAEAGAGISWDVAVEAVAPGQDAEAGGGVSWDIDLTEQGAGAAEVNWDISVDTAPGDLPADPTTQGPAQAAAELQDPAVARLCADAGYRACLVEDVAELRAFLMQVWHSVVVVLVQVRRRGVVLVQVWHSVRLMQVGQGLLWWLWWWSAH
jgi:hypothetical protein